VRRCNSALRGRVSCVRLFASAETMSDEVSNFLRSVEQLKDRRLEEDEARSRELEEKILQEKRERQARRAGMSTFVAFPCFLLIVPPNPPRAARPPWWLATLVSTQPWQPLASHITCVFFWPFSRRESPRKHQTRNNLPLPEELGLPAAPETR
jgi:hypothetical protein